RASLRAHPSGRGHSLPAPRSAAPSDTEPALLAVVAEKTGYPADSLQLGMALEADLGIDSIKRVEILSALQERVPGLADVPAAELGAVRTPGDVLARLAPARRLAAV